MSKPVAANLALVSLIVLGACASPVIPAGGIREGTPAPAATATPEVVALPDGPGAPPESSIVVEASGIGIAPGSEVANGVEEAEPAPEIVPIEGLAPTAGPVVDPGLPRPTGTDFGYLLLDAETGRTIAEFNADLPLIPASTVKLATALVALDVLGPDHTFETALLSRGAIEDQTLVGDLILRGSGNPILDVADLIDLILDLRATGIRAVDGRFIIDDMALPRLHEIEAGQPPEATYNASIGALSLAFNRVHVTWQGRAPVEVATVPPLSEALFVPTPSSRLTNGKVELKSDLPGNVVWQIAAPSSRRQHASLPVKDPGLHVGHVFRWLANANGIYVPAPERDLTPAGAVVRATHHGPPLDHLLRDMLVYSNNTMAELIGLRAAAELDALGATTEASGTFLLERLAHLMPDVDWSGAELANFSGLDPLARLTPRQIAAISNYGWRTGTLPPLLAGAGWSGTLAKRFRDDAALRVWAKTGTLNYGSALSGYILPDRGQPLVFVTMVSAFGPRTIYDLKERPSRLDDQRASAWNRRARALQDDLVATWLAPIPAS